MRQIVSNWLFVTKSVACISIGAGEKTNAARLHAHAIRFSYMCFLLDPFRKGIFVRSLFSGSGSRWPERYEYNSGETDVAVVVIFSVRILVKDKHLSERSRRRNPHAQILKASQTWILSDMR